MKLNWIVPPMAELPHLLLLVFLFSGSQTFLLSVPLPIPLLHGFPGSRWIIVLNLIADIHNECLLAMPLKIRAVGTGRALAKQFVFWGVGVGWPLDHYWSSTGVGDSVNKVEPHSFSMELPVFLPRSSSVRSACALAFARKLHCNKQF